MKTAADSPVQFLRFPNYPPEFAYRCFDRDFLDQLYPFGQPKCYGALAKTGNQARPMVYAPGAVCLSVLNHDLWSADQLLVPMYPPNTPLTLVPGPMLVAPKEYSLPALNANKLLDGPLAGYSPYLLINQDGMGYQLEYSFEKDGITKTHVIHVSDVAVLVCNNVKFTITHGGGRVKVVAVARYEGDGKSLQAAWNTAMEKGIIDPALIPCDLLTLDTLSNWPSINTKPWERYMLQSKTQTPPAVLFGIPAAAVVEKRQSAMDVHTEELSVLKERIALLPEKLHKADLLVAMVRSCDQMVATQKVDSLLRALKSLHVLVARAETLEQANWQPLAERHQQLQARFATIPKGLPVIATNHDVAQKQLKRFPSSLDANQLQLHLDNASETLDKIATKKLKTTTAHPALFDEAKGLLEQVETPALRAALQKAQDEGTRKNLTVGTLMALADAIEQHKQSNNQ